MASAFDTDPHPLIRKLENVINLSPSERDAIVSMPMQEMTTRDKAADRW